MRISSIQIIRPNGRPDIVVYPQSYFTGMKCADYIRSIYPNSTIKIHFMNEPELELIPEDADGWSRSFSDQEKYADHALEKERNRFWKAVEELNKNDR